MAEETVFDYYYGSQAEQFSFYRLPKTLIKDKRFRKISSDAKILYGIMLDRMSLSIKNKWVDNENRVYIIFTLEDVMEEFGCSERKAGYLLSELDTKSGVGLIEKKRQGLGRPNLIFVKNFQIPKDYSSLAGETETEKNGEALQSQSGKNLQVSDSKIPQDEDRESMQDKDSSGLQSSGRCGLQEQGGKDPQSQGGKNLQGQSGKILQVKSGKNLQVKSGKNLQVKSGKNLQVKSGKNLQVKSGKNLQVKSGKDLQVKSGNFVPPNNTNNNQTDYNYNNLIYPSNEGQAAGMGLVKEMDIYTEVIKENIAYDCLIQDLSAHDGDLQCIDEMLDLIVETVCMKCDTVRIGGKEYPYQAVKGRLLRIGHAHILYVLECLNRNTTKIRNIRAYLLATLFNAPSTIKNYYRAEVNHDLYGV